MNIDPLLISMISAGTALVASIVGPLVTLFVARRQFSATVLSTNRQKWIEELRDMLAELISLMVSAMVVKEKWKDKWDHGRNALMAEPGLLDKLQRMVLVRSKIQLLINPTESDHQHLYKAIDAAIGRLQHEESLESESQADIETITGLAQRILKREWQRVKLGT